MIALSAVSMGFMLTFEGKSYLELELIFDKITQVSIFLSIWLTSSEFPLTTPIPVVFSF